MKTVRCESIEYNQELPLLLKRSDREFDEAFRYGCKSGLPPKSPKLGTLNLNSGLEVPQNWRIWGAEALKNEAKELIERTFFKLATTPAPSNKADRSQQSIVWDRSA